MGEDKITLQIKWQSKDLDAIILSPSETISGIKRILENETGVLSKKQKLLGLRTKAGKPIDDTLALSELLLKPNQKIMMLGTVEKDLQALAAQEEVEPHVQLHDDFDDNDLEGQRQPINFLALPEVQEKLERRVQQAIIKELNPPRHGKKCAVFDIDYTIFDLSSVSEDPIHLARPHLHEFFAAIYPHYDIIIWSATSMKWIDVKLRELGVTSHPSFKITACMDYTGTVTMFFIFPCVFAVSKNSAALINISKFHAAMVTINAPGYSKSKNVFDCKPLHVLWKRFAAYYAPSNTIMCDDLRRNYVLNPQNGLVIRPFKRAMTSGKEDKELVGLKKYFLAIAELESLVDLEHDRWERYIRKNNI